MFSISGIIALITGLAGPVSSAIAKITDLKIAKVQASTDQEKLHIDAQIAEGHDRLMALQAEAGSRLNSIIRGSIAFGPASYITKVFFFDKVIGSFFGYSKSGSMFDTDALDVNLWQVVTVVLSFYFLYDMAATWRKK